MHTAQAEIRDHLLSRFRRLTEREKEITELAAHALSDREICEKLGIKHPTVRFHLGNVYAKLGVSSRVELAIAFMLVSGALP